MTTSAWHTLAATLIALPLLPSAAAAAPSRCSIAAFPDARDPDATVLLAAATADTLLAGAAAVEPSAGPGHWGPGADRPIYGQVVEVERFAGADSAVLAGAFGRQDARRVVVVPWDYDPSCRTAIWSRSARWVKRGEPGVYRVRLRPQGDWADGLPTFDAFFADVQPYPLGVFFERGYRGTDALRTGPSLTAAEYFELYRALPDARLVTEHPEEAEAAIARWKAANPRQAATYPATEVLRYARQGVAGAMERRHLRSIEVVVAGTYRFSVRREGVEPRTFFVRTRGVPISVWSPQAAEAQGSPGDETRLPPGYSLFAHAAASADSLPGECPVFPQTIRGGYLDVLEPRQRPAGTQRELVGRIDPRLVAQPFPADSALVRFARDAFDLGVREYRDRTVSTPARFVLAADGALRVHQTTVLEDGRTLHLSGERVSREVVVCPDRPRAGLTSP